MATIYQRVDGALDLTGPSAFLDPPSLPKPSLKWGSW
jgi:hypothetical protein